MALKICIKVFMVEMNQVQKATFEGRELNGISESKEPLAHFLSSARGYSSYWSAYVPPLHLISGVFSY
jgi:hypothetical protein